MTMRFQDKPNRRMRRAKRRMWLYVDGALKALPGDNPLAGFSVLASAKRENPYLMHFKWLEANHSLRYHIRMSLAWGRRMDTMRQYKRIPKFPGKVQEA